MKVTNMGTRNDLYSSKGHAKGVRVGDDGVAGRQIQGRHRCR